MYSLVSVRSVNLSGKKIYTQKTYCAENPVMYPSNKRRWIINSRIADNSLENTL